jgi:hypothetical protein
MSHLLLLSGELKIAVNLEENMKINAKIIYDQPLFY